MKITDLTKPDLIRSKQVTVRLISILACFLMIGCSSVNKESDATYNAQAKAEAESFWNSKLTKCGDTYVTKRVKATPLTEENFLLKDGNSVGRGNEIYVQLRGVEFPIQPLSQRDAEWRGLSMPNYRQLRLSRDGSNWSGWSEASADVAHELRVTLAKKNGKWELSDKPEMYSKVDCSQIRQ